MNIKSLEPCRQPFKAFRASRDASGNLLPTDWAALCALAPLEILIFLEKLVTTCEPYRSKLSEVSQDLLDGALDTAKEHIRSIRSVLRDAQEDNKKAGIRTSEEVADHFQSALVALSGAVVLLQVTGHVEARNRLASSDIYAKRKALVMESK